MRSGFWWPCRWSEDEALSLAEATGFALHGESLFLAWPRKSNPKEGHPRRQALRFAPGSLTPSSFQGHGPKGHPWPTGLSPHPCGSTPCAAIPFGLTKGEWVQAPPPRRTKSFFKRGARLAGNSPVPFRRPSAGVAEGASRMDAARAVKGHGCPLYGGPRSGAGAREPRRSRGRMTGCVFSLVTFSLHKQRESDSPCKAKPVASAEESARLGTKTAPKNNPAPGRESAPVRHQGQRLTRSMHRS
ncbi:hypothetical protein SAMN04244572_00279 [Azotobacter beijerinckii]|uniref:Uncharacterized protein n=1 Tax=Azotobacter beijerinckii TaxID=170623 RepID=A0A1H6QKX2_9GAMM|nr:hypothetical protein SAMN04244572_00279 [Azotobacter beijerinckii]